MVLAHTIRSPILDMGEERTERMTFFSIPTQNVRPLRNSRSCFPAKMGSTKSIKDNIFWAVSFPRKGVAVSVFVAKLLF